MIGTVEWLKRWIGPLAVVAVGLGSLAGAIWYRTNVPVVVTRGAAAPASTVTRTVSLPPQTAVETRTQVETVRLTPEPAPAKREVITAVREATVTETVTKTPEASTVTETETERVLKVDLTRKRGGGKDG